MTADSISFSPDMLSAIVAVIVATMTILGMMTALLWLIIRLLVAPLRNDVEELKGMVREIKPVDDIQRLIDLSVARHHENCLKKK